ncbi:MAG: hypothetical protein HFH62_06450 [Lachnospiraceae bacterium]|nr:hypothetical protein [Lachnospiraceae bacterium]
MRERERLYQLLDTVPDTKIAYLIGYIQGMTLDGGDVPNKETEMAMEEADQMVENGTGQHFEGSAKDFINMLLEE